MKGEFEVSLDTKKRQLVAVYKSDIDHLKIIQKFYKTKSLNQTVSWCIEMIYSQLKNEQ